MPLNPQLTGRDLLHGNPYVLKAPNHGYSPRQKASGLNSPDADICSITQLLSISLPYITSSISSDLVWNIRSGPPWLPKVLGAWGWPYSLALMASPYAYFSLQRGLAILRSRISLNNNPCLSSRLFNEGEYTVGFSCQLFQKLIYSRCRAAPLPLWQHLSIPMRHTPSSLPRPRIAGGRSP